MTAESQSAHPAKGKKKIKLSRRQQIVYGVLAVLAFLIWLGFQPLRGPMAFGLCRVLLEQQLAYPTEMQVNAVEIGQTNIRIEYTSVNPFGHTTRGLMDCGFGPDPQLGVVMVEAKMNGMPLPAAQIARFNQSIPAILDNPPSLNLPAQIPDGLDKLQAP